MGLLDYAYTRLYHLRQFDTWATGSDVSAPQSVIAFIFSDFFFSDLNVVGSWR
jgi:hypothetical protein